MLLNYVVVHTYDRLCLWMQYSVKLFEIQSCHVWIVMGCEVLCVNNSGKEIVYNPLKVFNLVRQRTEEAGVEIYKIKKKVVSNKHSRVSL